MFHHVSSCFIAVIWSTSDVQHIVSFTSTTNMSPILGLSPYVWRPIRHFRMVPGTVSTVDRQLCCLPLHRCRAPTSQCLCQRVEMWNAWRILTSIPKTAGNLGIFHVFLISKAMLILKTEYLVAFIVSGRKILPIRLPNRHPMDMPILAVTVAQWLQSHLPNPNLLWAKVLIVRTSLCCDG